MVRRNLGSATPPSVMALLVPLIEYERQTDVKLIVESGTIFQSNFNNDDHLKQPPRLLRMLTGHKWFELHLGQTLRYPNSTVSA